MKYLLLPFSWIYGAIAWLRNKLYDKGLLQPYHSPLISIVIGNLQVGGSGKTPLTAYLYWLLSPVYKTAILSRGYGRKTKGLIEANKQSTASEIGDEPFWYQQTLPGVKVVVAEKRKAGLMHLEKQDIDLVLLDDAYQHRAIKGDLEIMLTDYKLPYFKDFPLPFGRLREYRTGDKRADIIIITKCPLNLSLERKIELIQDINPLDHQQIFFTSLITGNPRNLKGNTVIGKSTYSKVIALSGIANPDSFIEICRQFSKEVKTMSFKDHHHYTPEDIKKVLAVMDEKTMVLTTEKDAVKLGESSLLALLPENRFYVIPVQPQFLFEEADKFALSIKTSLRKKKTSEFRSLNL